LFNLNTSTIHEGDVGLFLPLNRKLLERAAATPLPSDAPEDFEAVMDAQELTNREMPKPSGSFCNESLEASHSSTMTEETVDLKVPDAYMNVPLIWSL
jgi:hypothetical protein